MFRFREQFAVADEICGRWASSQGSGLPNDMLDDRSARDPLPDDLAIEVDRLIAHAPRDIRRTLTAFYRKRQSFPRVEDIAAHLGVKERRTVYALLRQSHSYLLLKLNQHGTLDRYTRRCERDRALRLRRAVGSLV